VYHQTLLYKHGKHDEYVITMYNEKCMSLFLISVLSIIEILLYTDNNILCIGIKKICLFYTKWFLKMSRNGRMLT